MLLNENQIIDLYLQGKSPYEIAEMYETYPNKIRRILKKRNIEIRDKSTAQSLGIQNGRIKHPTKGKELAADTKIKISNKVHEYWKNMSEEQHNVYSERAKNRWIKMTDAEKEYMRQRAMEALRKTAKDGSKLEKVIFDMLKAEKFNVQFHRKDLVANEKLEADLYIPELSTIIEIDGPSHFLPIWGEDKLAQTIRADSDKVGLALKKGFIVVRIKCLADNILERHKRQACELVLAAIRKIQAKTPTKQNRFIELEIDE